MKDNNLLLKVENLKTSFFSREGTVKAVDGVSFDINRGQTLGIVGESGCGKSISAQSILQLVPSNGRIEKGKILFNLNGEIIDLATLNPRGKKIRSIRGKEISMIFQEPMTSFSPVHTIGNQIMEVIRLHQNFSRKNARNKTLSLLKKVGMPEPSQIIDAYTFNLSGGMRQRAMIAMALSCQPSLLIADEPTTAIDVTLQAQVLELIKELQQDSNMALIIITHDLAVVAEIADKVLIMYLGKSIESAETVELYYNPKHPYTKGLLASIPRQGAGSRKKIEPIPGSIPSPYEISSGCLFHPRCPMFIAGLCDKKEPPEVEVGQNHQVRCFLYGE